MIEQRSEEWFNQRKGKVTGSVVGAILGLSPYMSRNDVMRKMVREYHGVDSEFKGNATTEWGQAMEPHAIADFELDTGLEVTPAEFELWDEDWLGASPDGYVNDGSLIEVKCPYSLRTKEELDFKSILGLQHYYAQIQIQLLVTNRESCYFYQWASHGADTDVVDFDPQWIDENLPSLRKFYQEYLIERDENAWKYLDGGDVARRYGLAKAALEVAKEELEAAKDALIEATDGENCKIGDYNITKVEKKGSISYQKAVKELAPDADLEEFRGKDSKYWRIS